ncbi:Hypothetical protein GLP15_4557 [Giardia lamblia P15]|uniref:Uncharacterized protein n=1 Tax=Giardia intestinalis (strain P15) TaxID=658858 RepID=E1F0Z2_GIAIA|nr:Hypothetical protein GLP15_4557 [Giardia lamblia P15]
MREWDFFVIAALYERVVEWGGTVDTLVSFLANEPIQTNPELGSLAGLFELNLYEYASHERLKEVLESGLSLSEHRKRCMTILQQAYPTQYDFLSFPPEHLKSLVGVQDEVYTPDADEQTPEECYSTVEGMNKDTFEKLWCFPTDGGFSGMYFVSVRVCLQQYRNVTDLLVDIYGTTEQGLRADLISPDDADGIYRSLMSIYARDAHREQDELTPNLHN